MRVQMIFDACGNPAELRRLLEDKGFPLAPATTYAWQRKKNVPSRYIPAIIEIAAEKKAPLDLSALFSAPSVEKIGE